MTILSNQLDIVSQWLKDNGVKINGNLIKLVYLGVDNVKETTTTATEAAESNVIVSGLGVVCQKDLQVDDIVAKIPKDVVLSLHTSSISKILSKIKGIEKPIATSIALMYEASIGKKSKWYGYISSLPTKVDLPILWDQESVDLLQGTVLEQVLAEDHIKIQEAFNKYFRDNLIKNHPEIFGNESIFNIETFKIASTIVSSRAFQVDSYHGDSLVPLADIFNHRTGRENVHIESNGDVCEKCGSFNSCKHRKVIRENEEEEEEEQEEEEEEIVQEEEQEGNDDNEEIQEEDDEHLYITVVRPVEKGKEVYNTYGDHDNAILLSKYGFLEMDNPCDRLPIAKELVDDYLVNQQTHTDTAQLKKRLSFYNSIFDQESRHNHSIDIDGKLDDAFICSLGICLAPAQVFLGWTKMSSSKLEKFFDALQADDIVRQSPLVKTAITTILTKRFNNYPTNTTLDFDLEQLGQLEQQQPQSESISRRILSLSLKICEKRLIERSLNYYNSL